jgi:predicted  nucleic acid-binding Zn-ribbon protein
MEENHRKIHEKIDPLMAREKELSPKQREIASTLLASASDMEDNLASLKARMEEIKAESHERAKSRATIRNKLYPNVKVLIKDAALLTKDERFGLTVIALEHGKAVLRAL